MVGQTWYVLHEVIQLFRKTGPEVQSTQKEKNSVVKTIEGSIPAERGNDNAAV
jgi:hypothetical protein